VIEATRFGRPLPQGWLHRRARPGQPLGEPVGPAARGEEHLEPLGVPVLYGLPTGHAKHLATLPWA
jgi:hypothetical protein